MRWRAAMEAALYGGSGFFVTDRPAAHFRTSATASPLFARAVATLLERVDEALGRPDPFDLVDVGAGGGELLTGILAAVSDSTRPRVRPVAVERAPRPSDLPSPIEWRSDLPTGIEGLLVATEWLDNVPVDIVQLDKHFRRRYCTVAPTGAETLDDALLSAADAAWLDAWWPLDGAKPGARAEIGLPRDQAWSTAVAGVRRGLALAVDYGHFAADRPPLGTLTAFRQGREVAPVPDGRCDLTVSVALDSLESDVVLTQREALHALGISGARPPLALASSDPVGYVRALAEASAAAELTDPAGLGGHHWVVRLV